MEPIYSLWINLIIGYIILGLYVYAPASCYCLEQYKKGCLRYLLYFTLFQSAIVAYATYLHHTSILTLTLFIVVIVSGIVHIVSCTVSIRRLRIGVKKCLMDSWTIKL